MGRPWDPTASAALSVLGRYETAHNTKPGKGITGLRYKKWSKTESWRAQLLLCARQLLYFVLLFLFIFEPWRAQLLLCARQLSACNADNSASSCLPQESSLRFARNCSQQGVAFGDCTSVGSGSR